MLTYNGTAPVSFSVPVFGVAFTPAADLTLAPEPGQHLGRLELIIADSSYDFSGAAWTTDEPAVSFVPRTGAAVEVMLDATGFANGDYEDFTIAYQVDF